MSAKASHKSMKGLLVLMNDAEPMISNCWRKGVSATNLYSNIPKSGNRKPGKHEIKMFLLSNWYKWCLLPSNSLCLSAYRSKTTPTPANTRNHLIQLVICHMEKIHFLHAVEMYQMGSSLGRNNPRGRRYALSPQAFSQPHCCTSGASGFAQPMRGWKMMGTSRSALRRTHVLGIALPLHKPQALCMCTFHWFEQQQYKSRDANAKNTRFKQK